MKTSPVLITGITGFIGSHLARRLVRQGIEVHGLIRPSSDLHLIQDLEADLHLHRVDGTTADMQRRLESISPAMIFHLASLFLASHRAEDIADLIASNVLFGTQLAEAAAAGEGIRPGFVNVGSSWQHYGSEDYHPVALYAATKQAFQDILTFYHFARQLPVVNVKLFDTYGPGDPRRKVLAVLRRAADAEQPIGMTGGEQFIDLVHVDDVIEALLIAGRRSVESPARIESFSVSSGRPLTIRALAETYERALGKPLAIEWGVLPYREREMMTPWYAGPIVPGWTPRVSLEEGLRGMETDVGEA